MCESVERGERCRGALEILFEVKDMTGLSSFTRNTEERTDKRHGVRAGLGLGGLSVRTVCAQWAIFSQQLLRRGAAAVPTDAASTF